jgi:6-phosphogluconolactonase (cycloisomerase 2 family)
MKIRSYLGVGVVSAAVAATAVAGLPGLASASPAPSFAGGGGRPVFVQTDNVAGNRVAAYQAGSDGHLTAAGSYATGGLGGTLSGSVVDHLASQGSLTYDGAHDLLYAVNAGSNTLSVFAVHGDQLQLRQVVASGGTFPVSVAVHGDAVYVLNAENGGSIQGYAVAFGHLVPVPGSARALGLDPSASPQFTNTPGQVVFSPNGSQLIVTTKANGNDIDVFGVGAFGRLSAAPVVNVEPGAVPFGVTFDAQGDLVVAEAGPNALATFHLGHNGTLTPIASVATAQTATCWVVPAGRYFYASNAGSGTVSAYQAEPAGQLALLGSTATHPGTVDASATPDGRFLYVQTGGMGVVDGYRVGHHGGLTPAGSVTVPGAVGGEGIVAL